MQFVLLDTAVATGVISSISTDPAIKKKGQRWVELVMDLVSELKDPSIKIPTPVFYEIAAKNKESYKIISKIKADVDSGVKSPIFDYINHSITPETLDAATRYRAICRDKGCPQDIEWVDAIIAVYCLSSGHCLITPNQKDFPELFFEVKKIGLRPLDKPKSSREFVVLLIPRLDNWKKEMNA